jgi:signal transduction histidine kinase
LDVVPSQFKQFFYNLFSNAIKFAKVGGPSSIEISGQNVTGAQYPDAPLKIDARYSRILISDNGIGFEQRYADQVFGIFQRLHGQEEYRGTGIGLAIVKKVIQNHSGFISVKSSSGNGAQFEIFLPVKPFPSSGTIE